jgi:hypothetical protein
MWAEVRIVFWVIPGGLGALQRGLCENARVVMVWVNYHLYVVWANSWSVWVWFWRIYFFFFF